MEKINVVTGGSSGLGKAIVSELLNKGLNVCIVSRNDTKIAEAIKEFPKGQTTVISYAGDVCDEAFVTHLFSDLKKKDYYVDYLYNNAGIAVYGEAKDMNLSKIRRAFDTNAIGALLMAYEACRYMNESGGTIINVASTAALRGNPKETLYCATKWALRGFTEAMKVEFKGKNIHIIGAYPGAMNTPFWTDDCGLVLNITNWMDPTEVASVIVNCALNKKTISVGDVTFERK